MNNGLFFNDNNYNFLYDLVIKEIDVIPNDILYGISFIGAPGVGKTTIANLLSRRLGLYVASNDWIRRKMDELGLKDNQDVVKKLALYRTEFLLRNHMSFILDCNLLGDYELARCNFRRYEAPLFIILLTCDEIEIKSRLEKRKRNITADNYSNAYIREYINYKHRLEKVKLPMEHIFFAINTTMNLEEQLLEFEHKLSAYLQGEKI